MYQDYLVPLIQHVPQPFPFIFWSLAPLTHSIPLELFQQKYDKNYP